MKRFLFFAATCGISAIAFAQNGKVGINTSSPQAALHVKDSGVLFTGVGTFTDLNANPPASGPGIRMMWFPQKGAMRAGIITATNWDRDSIGLYSVAFGFNSKAKGETSFAIGRSTAASGEYSTATGLATTAQGFASFVAGEQSVATGEYSFASGYNSKANAFNSVAIGGAVTANANHAFATGLGTRADGLRSATFGDHTIARSPECMVVGLYNDTTYMTEPFIQNYTQPLFVIGNGTANNNRQNVMIVLANGRIGIGIPGTIFAKPITATLHLHNNGSHQQQLAFTSLFSNFDTAYVRWDDRTLKFRNTTSVGSFWQFENEDGVRKVLIYSTGDIDIEGGLTAKRACGINTITPSAGLHIKAINNTFDQHIRLESTAGPASYANILYDGALKFRVFDAAANFQWRDAASNTRMTLTSAGNLTIAGTLTQNSDARLKKEIVALENSLEKILSLSSYHYRWKDSARGNALQTGLLAQQVATLMPELVTKDKDGILSVNYNGMIPYLIEAMKSQQQMINELKEQNRLLRSSR
jgi:hypothetical protein